MQVYRCINYFYLSIYLLSINLVFLPNKLLAYQAEVTIDYRYYDTEKYLEEIVETLSGSGTRMILEGFNEAERQIGRNTRFEKPTPQNINVWVCKLPMGMYSHAQNPGGPEMTDGILLDYRLFGTGYGRDNPYNQGKTLTHLMGNFLGLKSLWGEGRCNDDRVADTPIHNAPNSGCPRTDHVSTCDGYPLEMTMNFMDNTFDRCMYMFTRGQNVRMHTVLGKGGPRGSLVSE